SDPDVKEIKDELVYYSYKTIPFSEWTGDEKKILNLYPGYKEPYIPEEKNGVKAPRLETLLMFIAKARFIIPKDPDHVDLGKFLDVNIIRNLDHSVDQAIIAPGDVITYKDASMNFRNPPDPERWCQNSSLCIHSHYIFPVELQKVINLLMILRGKKNP